jgi:hypothetical protein
MAPSIGIGSADIVFLFRIESGQFDVLRRNQSVSCEKIEIEVKSGQRSYGERLCANEYGQLFRIPKDFSGSKGDR